MGGTNDFQMILNNFLKSAENIITWFDDDKDKRNEFLDKLRASVETNCFNSLRSKKLMNTTREVTLQIDSGNKSEDIMKLFNEKKDVLMEYQPNVSTNEGYKEYCRQVKELVDNADGVKKKSAHEDDDIEMTQTDINVIDPFTKKRMTDPVKNKICGHIYDHHSLTEILKVNPKTRCPVVGCSNKSAIDVNDVVPDIVTRKYLHDNP